MPENRKLTPDELTQLEQAGYDTSSVRDRVLPVPTPDELSGVDSSKMGVGSAIANTAKAHAGGWLGGGLGTAGIALAPFTEGLSLIPSAIAMAAGGMAGSYLGSKAQSAILPNDVNANLQQQAEVARQQHPYVSLGTDVVGGALASGGTPSLTPISMAGNAGRKLLTGAGRMITPMEKQALSNVITANAVNTGINAGVQYGTTGKIDPTDLAASAAGGALFANPSRYGKLINPKWHTINGEPTQSQQTEPINVTSTGGDYDQLIKQQQDANEQVASKQVSDVNNRIVAQEQFKQEQDKNNTIQRLNGILDPAITSDKDIGKDFSAEFITRPKGDAISKAEIRKENEQYTGLGMEEKRKLLYGKRLADISPEHYQQWVNSEQQKSDYQQWWDSQSEQEPVQAHEPVVNPKQELTPTEPTTKEPIQTETKVEPKPMVTPEQFLALSPEDKAKFVQDRLNKDKDKHQLADPKDEPSFNAIERALPFASNMGVKVGEVKDGLTIPANSPQNQSSEPINAKGIAFTTLRKGGQRLIGLARKYATDDTGFHELYHWLRDDLRLSNDPKANAFGKGMDDAFGGEEPSAQAVGKKFVSIDDAINKGVAPKFGEYLKAVWSNLKYNLGKANADDMARLASHNIREASPNSEFVSNAVNTKGGKSPDPNWQVTVQGEQQLDANTKVPGYVQIDDVSNGENKWSSNPEKLRKEGYDIPELNTLPTGKYKMSDVLSKFQAETKQPTFMPTAEWLINHPEELKLSANRNGAYNGTQLVNTLRNRLHPDEFNVLRDAGLESFNGRIVNQDEIKKWISDNEPKVEVRKFGKGGFSPDAKELSELTHNWFDNLSSRAQDYIKTYADGSPSEQRGALENIQENYNDIDLGKLKRWSELRNKVDFQKENSVSHWQSIAPKSEQDMPGYVEIAVTKGRKQQNPNDLISSGGKIDYTTKGQPLEPEKFPSSHNFPPNTLGFVRGYMETLPTGKKVFHVIEVQSDWAKKVREAKESKDPIYDHEGRQQKYIDNLSDPLLPHYERLALKAAIDHARSEGADALAISDAETAMLTEGHDRFRQGERFENVETGITEPPQSKGMRLHYDQTLPKITAELTGEEGERVEFGEHKMSLHLFGEHPQEGKYRKDLIFRNADGTPKISVSARMYPLDQVNTKLNERPFSLFNKYQPANEKNVEPDDLLTKSPAFRPTRAALDTIRHIASDSGQLVANALHQTFSKREQLMGKWWNPIYDAAKGLSKEQLNRVDSALFKETNSKESALTMLRSQPERQLYNTIRKTLTDSGQHRIDINEPVFAHGQPRLLKPDPFYYPTTENLKQGDIIRQGTDANTIETLHKAFVNQYTNAGESPLEAEKSWKQFVDSHQGSWRYGDSSNDTYFNAIRRSAGIPLPNELRRTDLMDNLFNYFRRTSIDNAYFEHVESKHKVAAALGYKTDLWGNKIEQPDVNNIAGNNAVKAVMNEVKGQIDTIGNRAEHAIESFATATLLGPLTELHKVVSTLAQSFTYANNPIEAAHTMISAVTNIGEGWTHAKENGRLIMDNKSARDFLDNNLTFAERLAGLSRAVRGVYTLGGLTEKVTAGLGQASGEYLVPLKVKLANEGDVTAQRLVKFLDPSYAKGKQYNTTEIKQLASNFAGMLHGTRDARTLPSWMLHDNEISAFFKLSSWGIAQTNNFMRFVFQPATEGNLTPLIMSAFGATMGGYVIKELREKLAGKKSNIPSLSEIAASSKGVEGNIPAIAYNWMAAASYAGFAGILSNVARYPFDFAFRNKPQGATFPLDNLVTNVGETAKNVADALLNDPTANPLQIATHALTNLAVDNIQLGRVAINHAIDSGVIGKGKLIDTELGNELQYRKQLSDKEGELRRFKQTEGYLVNEQGGGGDANPYMNLEQTHFKHNQNVNDIATELPQIVNHLITNYGDKPDVLLTKLRSLKQMDYNTFPNIESTPLMFAKYLAFLKQKDGTEAANSALMDYMMHRVVNQAKSSVVP